MLACGHVALMGFYTHSTYKKLHRISYRIKVNQIFEEWYHSYNVCCGKNWSQNQMHQMEEIPNFQEFSVFVLHLDPNASETWFAWMRELSFTQESMIQKRKIKKNSLFVIASCVFSIGLRRNSRSSLLTIFFPCVHTHTNKAPKKKQSMKMYGPSNKFSSAAKET